MATKIRKSMSPGRQGDTIRNSQSEVRNTEIDPVPVQFSSSKDPLIEGVKVRFLKPIVDERGRLMEMLKADWPEFSHFGQVYMTTAYPGVVKAWHYHKEQTDNFVCVQGMIKLVLYDGRKSSKTFKAVNEFCMGIHHAILVQIPPLVYHGFKCISEQECLLINVPTHPYRYEDPDEYRLEAHTPKIPYNWERKDG